MYKSIWILQFYSYFQLKLKKIITLTERNYHMKAFITIKFVTKVHYSSDQWGTLGFLSTLMIIN